MSKIIKEKMPNIVDGSLYFAVDTKQIYLDYAADNDIYEGPERIKFGGSTGIWYGLKTDTGDVDLPSVMNGGKCEITTDTGDIKISIEA